MKRFGKLFEIQPHAYVDPERISSIQMESRWGGKDNREIVYQLIITVDGCRMIVEFDAIQDRNQAFKEILELCDNIHE